MKERKREEFLVRDKAFYKKLLMIAWPIILQNMITIGVNMMDTIMLGTYGEAQLSGSSLANDFINIFQIFCMGMGCGAAVLTAIYWGQKEIDSLKKVVAVMLRVALGMGLIFTVLTIFFSPQIMRIYTKEPEVIEQGVIYFKWSIPTYFLMCISLTLTQILRSVRSVKIPLYASIVSFFVNIFFNWVFIFGHLGAPEMQIAGAALGTVIARIVEVLIIAGNVFFVDQKIRFRVSDIFKPVGDITGKYVKYCLPVLASDSLLAFGNSAVSIIIGHLGMNFIAAYAIIAMIQRLCTIFTSGIGQAAHTITGNSLGEGEKQRAYQEGITMLLLSFLLGIAAALVMRLFGPYIIGFYEITEETRKVTIEMLDAILLMIAFQSAQSVLTKGVLRGGGDTKFCLVIDAGFLWTVSVPLGALAGLVLHLPAFFILIFLKIDWIIKTVLGTIRLFSKKWIKSIE